MSSTRIGTTVLAPPQPSPNRTVHPTSSLRDPLPDATPPGRSRSGTPESPSDDYMRHPSRSGGRKKGRRERSGEESDEHASPRGDKRRRVKAANGTTSPHDPPRSARLGPSTLAPIKPIGFAASREARREEGDRSVPSPVVMGFDFKAIDGDQLKTVRDTISIKEQQQALIAQRRREVAASQPSTPKELTFKGWTPKESKDIGVGRRREKTRDKVERLSIVTSASEKDIVPGSKSAPLGHAPQLPSPRDPPSGSQTSVPHILPPISGYPNGMTDPRTAPIRRNGDEHEFARQQFYPRAAYPHPVPHTAHPRTIDRRNFTAPHHAGPPPNPNPNPNPNASASPPPQRDTFLQPFNQLYDLLHQTEQLRFDLQSLMHQCEQTYGTQRARMDEFKGTAAQARDLLGSLQASADSLKDMVRYEVGRGREGERREMDELKERIRVLEEGGRGREREVEHDKEKEVEVEKEKEKEKEKTSEIQDTMQVDN
ncbi:hypothetical protein BCR39DRAFT_536941 [Naematelia encephala]|uniref:Uncharacterized protein n=1 Tax=Naematelia encephala TaxID=71784 RepID=A0A1Y2AYV2_9TREE|nr:hypothetical protein BCR39DRAFT_536941 [Naematelia encephala]